MSKKTVIAVVGAGMTEGGQGTFVDTFKRVVGGLQDVSLTDRIKIADKVFVMTSVIEKKMVDFIKQSGKPYFHRFAGYYMRENPKFNNEFGVINKKIDYALKACNHAIFASYWAKKVTSEYFGIPMTKSSVVYNGSTLNNVVRDTREPSKNILVIGRFRHDYQITLPIDIIMTLGKDYNLFFLGQDHFKINSLKPCSNSNYLGAYKKDDLPGIIAKHNISVAIHPTSGDWGPNTVVELLSMGIPVVCQKYGGTKELISGNYYGHSGDAGIVVDSKPFDHTSAKLIEGMCYAIMNIRDRYEQYYHNAVKRGEILTASNMVNQYLKIIGV